MHTVDIEVFCIAQTRMNKDETRKWLDRCGATKYPVPFVSRHSHCEKCQGSGFLDFIDHGECPECKGTGTAPAEVTDAGAVCGLCAKRCYMSFEPGLNPNVTKVRKDWHEYLTNLLKSKHGSVTEHASWTWAIEGVSRVFTGEMNRHRAGVGISEGSMRYIRFDDIGFWMPLSLQPGNQMLMPTKRCPSCKGSGRENTGSKTRPSEWQTCTGCDGTGRFPLTGQAEFEEKKAITQIIFGDAFEEMEKNYKNLCRLWGIEGSKSFDTKKKLTSMFRRLIGMGAASGGCWTINTRAIRHIMTIRTPPHVEEEIAYVWGMIGKRMFEGEPDLFGDFKRDEATGAWVPEHVKI